MDWAAAAADINWRAATSVLAPFSALAAPAAVGGWCAWSARRWFASAMSSSWRFRSTFFQGPLHLIAWPTTKGTFGRKPDGDDDNDEDEDEDEDEDDESEEDDDDDDDDDESEEDDDEDDDDDDDDESEEEDDNDDDESEEEDDNVDDESKEDDGDSEEEDELEDEPAVGTSRPFPQRMSSRPSPVPRSASASSDPRSRRTPRRLFSPSILP